MLRKSDSKFVLPHRRNTSLQHKRLNLLEGPVIAQNAHFLHDRLIPTDFDPEPAGDGLAFGEILLLAWEWKCFESEFSESNCSKS